MAGEFINFKIDKVIIHKIFKRENKENMLPPLYNETCSTLDIDAKRALITRITRAFGNDAHSLEMSIEDTGEESVYKYITNFWLTNQSDTHFIELSKRLTKSLAEAQTSKLYPDGIVIVLKGTTKPINVDYIAIIKAEISDGFNIENNNGESIIQYVNNLLLTGQQKLHKIGLFINNQVRGRQIEKKDVSVFLFDSNTADSVADAKSAYFYKTFLGLKFREDADYMTNKFYTGTKRFINNSGLEPAERIRLQTALHGYLVVRNSLDINMADFANEFFTEDSVKDKYLNEMEGLGVPRISIRKDLSMISNKKTRKLSFENAVKITAPIDEFDENVIIEDDGHGNTIVTIKGKYINE